MAEFMNLNLCTCVDLSNISPLPPLPDRRLLSTGPVPNKLPRGRGNAYPVTRRSRDRSGTRWDGLLARECELLILHNLHFLHNPF